MINNVIDEAENAINWIRNYVANSGAKGVVLGNSGGKDSATVLAMAVKALGKEKVLAVGMPCNSIPEDLEDAWLVANHFGVKMIVVDLTTTYNEFEKTIQDEIKCELINESKINIKPRLRMTTLYGIAQNYGYLVIGTGNLCERMVGYTTKWGDSSFDFNPIGNFTVQEVLAIGEYLGVPEKIIKKAPSDGLGGLTDEQKLGVTYKQISEFIETGKTDEFAMSIIKCKYNSSKHKRVLPPMYYFERDNYLEEQF